MNRNLKSLIQEMDRKTEYKRKSTSIADEGTLIHVGSEGGRQELAMVLKFVKGSQVARPHEDFIVIGTYKYSDIDTQIKINAEGKPPILLIIAKVTGRNSYKVLTSEHMELMQRIKAVAGRDRKVSERCNDLFKFELIQCLGNTMAMAYTENREMAEAIPTEGPDGLDELGIESGVPVDVDLSGPSAIAANTVAIVEDQDDRIDGGIEEQPPIELTDLNVEVE